MPALSEKLQTAIGNDDIIAESKAGRPAGAASIPRPAGLSDDYLPYQAAGIQYASQRNTLIGDEMGLGKTVQALGTVNNLGSDRVLIVAPPSLLANWQREADKWVVGDPPIHIVKDGRAESWQMPEAGPGITVIGYSNLGKHREELRNADWDMVILDEAHYIGNPNSQRTQEIVGCIEDACKSPTSAPAGTSPIDADRKLLLTGTPYDAKVKELWPLVSYLAPEIWGKTGNTERQAEFSRLFWDAGKKRGKNLRELQAALRGSVMLRRTGDDVHDQVPLGPITRRTIILEPGTEAERLAVKQSGDLDVGPMEADITRPNANPKFSEISRILADTALAKAPQVGRYVADAARDEPIVFFAYHKPLLHAVSAELKRAGVKHDVIDGEVPPAERAKMVQRFQDGRTDAILLSQGTGKEGFTLTRSRRAIFGDLSWRPTDLLQAEKRIHRIGQKGDVLVEYMVLDDSLDGMQADVMARKMASITAGIGVSESSAAFGGASGDDDDDLYGRPQSQSRAEFCETAPPTPASRRTVEKWARHDVRLSLAKLQRAAKAAGLPDPTRPAMQKALAETESVGIDANTGKPVLIMDDDAAPGATVVDLPAPTPTPTPTPEPWEPAPDTRPEPPPVVNEPETEPPEPPPVVYDEPETEPKSRPAPTPDESPFPAGVTPDADDDIIPLKPDRKWGRMDNDAKLQAVARFNAALMEYQQATGVLDAVTGADNPADAIAAYCPPEKPGGDQQQGAEPGPTKIDVSGTFHWGDDGKSSWSWGGDGDDEDDKRGFGALIPGKRQYSQAFDQYDRDELNEAADLLPPPQSGHTRMYHGTDAAYPELQAMPETVGDRELPPTIWATDDLEIAMEYAYQRHNPRLPGVIGYFDYPTADCLDYYDTAKQRGVPHHTPEHFQSAIEAGAECLDEGEVHIIFEPATIKPLGYLDIRNLPPAPAATTSSAGPAVTPLPPAGQWPAPPLSPERQALETAESSLKSVRNEENREVAQWRKINEKGGYSPDEVKAHTAEIRRKFEPQRKAALAAVAAARRAFEAERVAGLAQTSHADAAITPLPPVGKLTARTAAKPGGGGRRRTASRRNRHPFSDMRR